MSADIFMIIMTVLFVVVGIILFNICKYAGNVVVSKITLVLLIIDVVICCVFGIIFTDWFNAKKTKGEEIEHYEIIDAALTTTKHDSRYAVSFADSTGNITVVNVLYQEYTDEDSYIALHRFYVGFLYEDYYVYYINKPEEAKED